MVINQFPFGLSPKQFTIQFGLCQGTPNPHRCEMVGGFYRCTLKIEYVVPVRSIYFFCTVVGLRSRWDATDPAIKYNPHRQKPPSRDAGSGESGRTPAARNFYIKTPLLLQSRSAAVILYGDCRCQCALKSDTNKKCTEASLPRCGAWCAGRDSNSRPSDS